MAWENRNGSRYYYRKRRVGRKVVSEYIGQGQLAELFAQCDHFERHAIAIARQAQANYCEAFRRVDQSIEDYRRLVRKIVLAALIGAGFHQHRGQWRMARTVSNKVTKSDLSNDEFTEYFKLYRTAQENPAVVPQLREFALAHPNVFDKATVLGITTLASVLTTMNMSKVSAITTVGELDALRRSLGGDTDTRIEKLLIEDVVICWLRMQLMEHVYSQNVTPDQYSIIKVEHLERRLSATRRRYLQSVETLVRVRRLFSRVGTQINIAQQQIVANS